MLEDSEDSVHMKRTLSEEEDSRQQRHNADKFPHPTYAVTCELPSKHQVTYNKKKSLAKPRNGYNLYTMAPRTPLIKLLSLQLPACTERQQESSHTATHTAQS